MIRLLQWSASEITVSIDAVDTAGASLVVMAGDCEPPGDDWTEIKDQQIPSGRMFYKMLAPGDALFYQQKDKP